MEFALAGLVTDACHQLVTVNGMTEMAFVGETPWHHLGQQLPAGCSTDDMIKAARMAWKIKRSRIRFATQHGAQAIELHTITDQHVLFREDTKQPLGIVSDGYKIVQPAEVIKFFDNLVRQQGYELCTAGVLFGGKKFWALAKVAEGAVIGGDKIGAYILVTSSCDGSSATEVRFTAIRVVCNNTFTLATRSKADAKVSHRSKFNVAQVQQRMGLVHDAFADYLAEARELAAKRISDRDAAAFVRKLLRPEEVQAEAAKAAGIVAAGQAAEIVGADDFARLMGRVMSPQQVGDDAKTRAPKGEAEILALFRGHGHGAQLAGAMGTAWGLVNAVTEYVDHKAQAKSIDHRVDRAFFGSGDELKTRAFELARAL